MYLKPNESRMLIIANLIGLPIIEMMTGKTTIPAIVSGLEMLIGRFEAYYFDSKGTEKKGMLIFFLLFLSPVFIPEAPQTYLLLETLSELLATALICSIAFYVIGKNEKKFHELFI